MLNVSNLSRRYGGFLAVDNVSFTIAKGEIVGLLGHNGAGKTTIMKMLSGFLEPHQGQVSIEGLDVAHDTKQAQRLLGYLPENPPIYPEMRVADYLDYAARLKGLTGDTKTRAIRRALAATDIQEKLLAPIGTLSRGFKQRVGVAQAILGEPKLLILDEPTNGLDPTQTQQMRDLIRELAKEATVILSTHIMQEVEALCDRVLIIRAGKLAVDAHMEDLRTNHSLLLATDLSATHLEQELAALSHTGSLTSLETLEGHTRYRLSLAEGADISATAAALARGIHNAGGQLFQLQPESRDLESLFREVNQQEAMTHAA
jgi:ABC-2 type transport system ATP-binding protein